MIAWRQLEKSYIDYLSPGSDPMEIKLSHSPKIPKQFTWEEQLTNLWWDGEPQRRRWSGEIGCLWLSQTESCCPSHQPVMAENKKSWILEIKARQEEEELWGSHADTKNFVCNRQICWAEQSESREAPSNQPWSRGRSKLFTDTFSRQANR